MTAPGDGVSFEGEFVEHARARIPIDTHASPRGTGGFEDIRAGFGDCGIRPPEANPIHAPTAVLDRLEWRRELAPGTRFLRGPEGHGAPEGPCFAALVIQEAWREARRRWARRAARTSGLDSIEITSVAGNTRRLDGF